MMNKYVQATIGWSYRGLTSHDFEKSVMIFNSYEDLLNYLCKQTWCKLFDYEEISVLRRKK